MPARSHVYPISMLLAERSCLVVGGARLAKSRVDGLLDAGARVTVIAPVISGEVSALPVTLLRRRFRAGDSAGYLLVISATGDPILDAAVYADARSAGALVNAVDEPDSCDFYLPAVLRRGSVTVAISTDGTSPALASWLRDRVGELFGDELELASAIVADVREAIRSTGRQSEGLDWRGLIDQLVTALGSGVSERDARLLADQWRIGAIAASGHGDTEPPSR